MSGSLTTSRSAAIPIMGNRYGYSIPKSVPSRYLFELKLELENGDEREIRKIDENRYTDLLDIDDDIDYEKIKSYNIFISVLGDNVDNTFKTSGNLKSYMSFFSNQDNNVYIEFNRLNNGKAKCTCRYVDYDNLGLSISPPF